VRRFAALVTAVVVILTAGSLCAQTTTGRLIGRVTDGEGVPLPGAAVTISSPALIGGAQSKETDDRGEYSFVGIAPGVYTVRAVLDGFLTQERSEVKVRLGGATALTIEMPQGRFTGEITVVDETPVVDPVQSNMEQVFDRNYLDRAAIGSSGRSYVSVLFQAAGADDVGSPNPSVFGSTVGENAYYIDGVDTTDPATSTFGVGLNFDAIQEIQIQTAGYEAEYGRAIGGMVNLVTRSGGNQFSGTLDARYRDDAFYESGDHFDSSELDNEYTAAGFTLGGPIGRDRLWFFTAYEHRRITDTPVGSPTTRKATFELPLAKLSWQIDPSWRLVAKYSASPNQHDNANASAYVAPEATQQIEWGGPQASVELAAILSDRLLWSTVGGIQRTKLDAGPQDGDISTPGHLNLSTGESYINLWGQEHEERARDELATDLSWFVDDVAGAHELKLGVEYGSLMFNDVYWCDHNREGRGCETGAVVEFFIDAADFIGDRDPLFWVLGEARSSPDFEGALWSGFVQDAWRPLPGLTLKLGVRYDTIDWDDNEGTTVATLDKLQPRVGFAWDLTGDARNLVRGSWGRFMHPANLSVPFFLDTERPPGWRYGSCSVWWGIILGLPTSTAEECQAFAQAIDREYRTDPDGWDPAGWIFWQSVAPGVTEIDPNIRTTYADEWLLSYERALWDRSSVEISYVNKKTRDILEDTCRGNFYDGPSEDADCGAFLIFNHPTRDYEGAVVRFETRTLNWLTLLASYTYSHSRGSADSGHYFEFEWDFYPENWVNRYGYLNNQRRHRVKLNGFVLLPADITLSVDAFWSDDFRYTPYTNSTDDPSIADWIRFEEPRGNRTANDNSQIDFQFSKGFTLGAVRLELIASVYNLLSSERPTGVCEHVSGCSNPEGGGLVLLGAPIEWQEPRSYELGFRLEF
jgi:hypothetical protein